MVDSGIQVKRWEKYTCPSEFQRTEEVLKIENNWTVSSHNWNYSNNHQCRNSKSMCGEKFHCKQPKSRSDQCVGDIVSYNSSPSTTDTYFTPTCQLAQTSLVLPETRYKSSEMNNRDNLKHSKSFDLTCSSCQKYTQGENITRCISKDYLQNVCDFIPKSVCECSSEESLDPMAEIHQYCEIRDDSWRSNKEDMDTADFSSPFTKSNLLLKTMPFNHHSYSLPSTSSLFSPLNSLFLIYLLHFSNLVTSSFSSCVLRISSLLRSCSSPSLNSILMCSLVWSCFLTPSTEASSFPPSKFSSDSYGIWDRSLTLDDDGRFIVEWTASDTDVQFRLTAQTRGYIGFGLSSHSRMHGADIVVGWVHSGKAYLQDRHGIGNLEPAVDRFQDWTIVSGYENDTHTVLHVSRPLNTCDPDNDHIISNDTSRMLWAYHPDDPVDPDSPRPRLHYHGDSRRGAKTVFLLDRDPEAGYRSNGAYGRRGTSLLEDPPAHTWTLTSPGVEVRSEDATVYWCKLFRKPLLVQKNHIIKFEPVFSAGNERHVHHMILYECTSDDPSVMASLEQLADSSGDLCYSENMSQFLRPCSHVVVAWAVGSKGLTLPPEAGYPLSPNGPSIFLMQVHYDNPDRRHFEDYSGIRVHYTHVLRSYDAGVLSVGLDPSWKHLIPPEQPSVLSSGHCVSECTQKALPSTGIKVFGAVVQTHLLGREVKIRHLRNGIELDPIAQDKNYDYNYLEYRLMKTPTTVMPGDDLISECRYNSLKRSAITLGGINTRDEMCLSYLFYWPRSSLSLCHSKPSLNTVLQSLGIQELSHDSDIIKIRKPVELAGKTLQWRLTNYDWQNQFDYFQSTTHKGTFNPMCWSRGHSLLPNLEELDHAYPNITVPWVAENRCRKPHWSHPKDSNPHHRRQRPHHRRQHPHLSDGLQDDADPLRSGDHLSSYDGGSLYDGGDVMFDDDMNTKPIKRIDADPVRKYDVYMPSREDFFDSKVHGANNPLDTRFQASESSSSSNSYGNSGRTVNTRNQPPYDDLREEFDAMERDLEEEVNHNRLPDSFQERTAHKPRANSAVERSPVLWRLQIIALSFVIVCNVLVLSRLKEVFC
uniref:MOXD1 homolog 2-like n=2 Tax=Hirondellea gigas TaxID=1518452 RepID=A0A6A7G1R7_9CRUS